MKPVGPASGERLICENRRNGVLLSVESMNAAVRRLWQLPDKQPDGKLAYTYLVEQARQSKCLGMSGEALEIYL
jgi:hypothetical protein